MTRYSSYRRLEHGSRLAHQNAGRLIDDGLGRRARIVEKDDGVETANNWFVWDGSSIVEKRNETGTTWQRRYYAHGFADAAHGDFYYTKDHLGSTREIVAADGTTLAARYDYDPYGNVATLSEALPSDNLYTGHYHHRPTGLHLALHRAYDAELSIWLSRDPIRDTSSEGFDQYGYVRNNPSSSDDSFESEEQHGEWGPDGNQTAAEVYEQNKASYISVAGLLSPGEAVQLAHLQRQRQQDRIQRTRSDPNHVSLPVYTTNEAFGIDGAHHLYVVDPTGQNEPWGRHGSYQSSGTEGTDRGGRGAPGFNEIPVSGHSIVGEILLPSGVYPSDYFDYLEQNGMSGVYWPGVNDCHNSIWNGADAVGGIWIPSADYKGRL